MRDKFYELSIKSINFYDKILELVFSFGITCVEERSGEIVIRDEDDLKEIEWGVCEYCKRLSGSLSLENDLKTSIVQRENKDWINEYKRAVKPILLGKFYIRPSWEAEKEDSINIIIDPALAFGSGHHESTSSCLLFLQKYVSNNLNAIDVGCGSGILSIGLAKLGCRVDACDTDEQAVYSSKQNANLNNVEFNKIWTGSIAKLDKKYDVVVANIIADVIFMLEKDLKNILNNDAYLVLSGILLKYSDRVKDAFSDLKLVEEKIVNDWISFVFKKNS